MKKIQPEEGKSADIVSENIERLKELFPDAFSEGGVDFDVLRQLLGDAKVLDEGEEKYGLVWHGKKKARQIALTPSTGTLLPCPEESVDWDTTQNLFIEGDNLEVLKLLQKSYANKVKMIYIDPPYNTDKDFIYPDKYTEGLATYLRYTGQKSDEGDWTVSASGREKTGRKHTNWLNMMYSRLYVAKSLLSQSGVIAISIGPEEISNLLRLFSEIFGEENKISVLTWEKGRKNDSTYFSESVEYMVLYAKSISTLSELGVWRERKKGIDDTLGQYDALKSRGLTHEKIQQEMRKWYSSLEEIDPAKELEHFYRSDDRGLYFGGDISSASTSIPDYDVIHPITNKPCRKPSRGWGCNPDEMKRRIEDGRVHFGEDESTIPLKKNYLVEVDSIVKTPVIYKDGRAATRFQKKIFGDVVFENPKDHDVLADIIGYACRSGGIILDFFAGSGTTVHAAWLNCLDGRKFRFILVQLPESLDEKKKQHKKAIALGYRTISEVAISRLKKTADVLSSSSDKVFDGGFKLFKLQTSNISAWNPDRTDLEDSLLSHEEHILQDRSELDVLYELLLKRGVDLAVPIENREVAGKTVYSIGYGVLFACLDESIHKNQVEQIAQAIVEWHRELAPSSDTHVFFRDSAFSDDVSKTNMTAILEQNGINHVRSL